MCPNRLELIQKAIDARSSTYKNYQRVSALLLFYYWCFFFLHFLPCVILQCLTLSFGQHEGHPAAIVLRNNSHVTAHLALLVVGATVFKKAAVYLFGHSLLTNMFYLLRGGIFLSCKYASFVRCWYLSGAWMAQSNGQRSACCETEMSEKF